ncbi:MAG: PBP1 and LysM peptidoglycan-binding domain-containing protein [Phocaeicola sp.]|uniref:PBP1 and LysM peptidoglycan-binding domain-containing protein n=1 Tax=Phocaeicola sp. TaxID=2773926 RepID=UPI003FA124BB
MKFFKTLYVMLALSVLPIAAFSQSQDKFFLHTITKGQSLYSIASMYNVTIDDIVRLNPGSDQVIKEGKTLKIPQVTAKTKQTFHTIQSGETLYRISVNYNVSANAICQANPGLSEKNFRAGQVIVIPVSNTPKKDADNIRKSNVKTDNPISPIGQSQNKWQDMHKVKKGETIFSLCRQYHITEDELKAANPELKNGKLKKGSYLAIPYSGSVAATNKQSNDPTNDELFRNNKTEFHAYNKIKVAVILPFKSDRRMVEYYEGFLLAADSLKKKGTSLDIYTYDSGTSSTSINPILRKSEMKNMDIIIGPAITEQIEPLSQFAQTNKIRTVIPFTSKDNHVFSNPYIYQINTPQSYLFSEVYDHFIRKFNNNANVIFLDTNDSSNDKLVFINGLKSELHDNHIPYTDLKGDNILEASMSAAADTLKNNIFIPVSGSNVTLIKLLPQLVALTKEHPEYEVHLFGYPEWQTYTSDHIHDFYTLGTYFYSSFYTNNLFPEAVSYSSLFRRWYGKEMANTYPKYGMLGFDTTYYLLSGLSRFGNNLEESFNKYTVTPIQTGFKFERVNNWGGFINKKVFFVHFAKNGELIKSDFEQ